MTTLADKIVHGAGSRLDSAGLFGGLTVMGKDIKAAEIFDFDASAAIACAQLARSKPSSLVEATKFCRVPFKSVWIEWSPAALSGLGKFGENWTDEHKAEVEIPNKMGCLVQCLDETNKRFGLAFAWDVPTSKLNRIGDAEQRRMAAECPVNVCPFGFVVNWHDGSMPSDMREMIAVMSGRIDKELALVGNRKKYVSDEKELAAIKTLLANRVPCRVPYCTKFIDHVQQTGGNLALERLQRASAYDLDGEYDNVIAMLCLLNSKNCVSFQKPELEKLNKARKKRGKEPFLVHSKVTINLSKAAARHATQAGATASEIRQHIVRGHFKIRSGGVFWWRPFLRGDAAVGQVERDGYRVVNRTAA